MLHATLKLQNQGTPLHAALHKGKRSQ